MKIYSPTNVNILYDSVLAKFKKRKDEKKEEFVKNKEGIFIPNKEEQSKKDDFLVGVVVRVGEGYVAQDGSIQKLRVKLHDTIVIDGRNSANNVIFESEDDEYEYRLIRESNILMVINSHDEEQIKLFKKEKNNEA